MRLLPVFSFLLGSCSAAMSGGAPSDALVITGELTYRQRIALPPSGEVVVMLQEVAAKDPTDDIVGSQHIMLTGQQVPIPFRLTIPRSALNPTRRYVVRATIHDNDRRLLWTTDQVYAVDPTVRGVNFNSMNLVPSTTRPGHALCSSPSEERVLAIIAIDGKPPVEGSNPVMRIACEGGLSVATGCNGLRGTITFDGALVSVSQLASTMMACAEPLMAQERAIARILGGVQQWREVGMELVLAGREGEIRAARTR